MPLPHRTTTALAAWALLLPLGASAQTPEALYLASVAATCANCHGTQGRPVPGSALPPLAGMPQEQMLTQMRAFRDGSRPATVMHQLAKGFSDSQLQQLAGWFAAQPR
ncbi:c-type cytochrome [Ramlibacter sp. AN1015]|uniref:c-type cytochrome n=1 Tax=Ramlibacter sp. AN1015 TaxID=3133428 RepID=UPI0030C03B68